MEHLRVAAGAGLGALVRWALGVGLDGQHILVPLVVVNIAGTVVLALVTAAPELDPRWRALIGTGFCGGLTTFSAVAVAAEPTGATDASLGIVFGLTAAVGLLVLSVAAHRWTLTLTRRFRAGPPGRSGTQQGTRGC